MQMVRRGPLLTVAGIASFPNLTLSAAVVDRPGACRAGSCRGGWLAAGLAATTQSSPIIGVRMEFPFPQRGRR